MKLQTRIDVAHALVSTRPLAHKPHQGATDVAPAYHDLKQPPWPLLYSGTAQLCDLLASRQQLLESALVQIDSLQRQTSTLKRRIARLTKDMAEARQFSYHDELTGLPNRRLLADRFSQAIARAARQQKHVALLILDLDRFKTINDSMGHAAGDNLLQQVAARLVSCVRRSDTVCRFGGDEFVVLLPELNSPEHAIAAEKEIRECLSKPYLVAGTTMEVTISVGKAVYPADGTGYVDLILRSDVTMYGDKARNHAIWSVPR